MNVTASPWRGLGSLNLRPGTKPSPQLRLADDEHDDFARPSVKRIVPASGTPSVLPANPIVSPFSHPFPASAGSADEAADSPAAVPHEEKSLPKTTATNGRKPRPTKGTSARFQICALLLSKGDLTVDEIKADVSADAKALNNAIYNAKAAGQIVFLAKADKWHLTAQGRAWTSGGANLDNHRAASTSPREVKRGRRQPREKGSSLSKPEKKRLGVVDLHRNGSPKAPRTEIALPERAEVDVVQERSFRCAVFSDGAFHLAKNGKAIDLTPAEFREAVRFLDRMGVEPEPAGA